MPPVYFNTHIAFVVLDESEGDQVLPVAVPVGGACSAAYRGFSVPPAARRLRTATATGDRFVMIGYKWVR